MQGFTKYFTFEAMTDSSRYPETVEANRKEAMQFILAGKRLSKMMTSVRLFLGVPMQESSGYRGPTLTEAGNFSETSKHTKFEALDSVTIGMPVEKAFYLIKENAHRFPDLRKVILEKVKGKVWLHMEVKMSVDEPQTFWTTIDGKSYTEVA